MNEGQFCNQDENLYSQRAGPAILEKSRHPKDPEDGIIFAVTLVCGQLASVEAQKYPSAQQNQFCSGQHPFGHGVPLQSLDLSPRISLYFAATSLAVEAAEVKATKAARRARSETPLIMQRLYFEM